MLIENYRKVLSEIEKACQKAGRNSSEVTLLPVSKTKPKEDIMTLYQAGVRDFGENYVQELREKQDCLPKDIRWHMIGHLQRNKVKYIAPWIYMIHSVDSIELVETIEKEAEKNNRIIPILIEVNVGEEESKFGLQIQDVPSFMEKLAQFSHVRYQGLMTSAPFLENPENDRVYFQKLRKLTVDINMKNLNNINGTVLSMGMSNDYKIAIEEGSTIVRVGSDIFGRRSYQ